MWKIRLSYDSIQKIGILHKAWVTGLVAELMIIAVTAIVVVCIIRMKKKKIYYKYGELYMKKIMKIAGIIIAFLVTTVLVISIISVNVKYHRYFDITELDGKDKYTTEWGNVSIARSKNIKQERDDRRISGY